jgi:hypothetical protein
MQRMEAARRGKADVKKFLWCIDQMCFLPSDWLYTDRQFSWDYFLKEIV